MAMEGLLSVSDSWVNPIRLYGKAAGVQTQSMADFAKSLRSNGVKNSSDFVLSDSLIEKLGQTANSLDSGANTEKNSTVQVPKSSAPFTVEWTGNDPSTQGNSWQTFLSRISGSAS